MTHLRDARLQHALDNAPDAGLLPKIETKNAIHTIATNAIQTSGDGKKIIKLSWWQRCWNTLGQQNAPWSAAFATLLLGGIITLLWHGQEIPDAAPDRQSTSATPAMPTPSLASEPPPVASSAPPSNEALKRAPVQITQVQPAPTAARAKAKEAAVAEVAEIDPTDKKSSAPFAKQGATKDVADASPSAAPPAGADKLTAVPTPMTSPAMTERPAAQAARAAAALPLSPVPAPAPAPATAAPAPAPAPAAMPAPAAAAPAASPRMASNDMSAPQWVRATLLLNGKTVSVSGAPLRALAQHLNTLIAQSKPSSDALPSAAAVLRLSLTSPTGELSLLQLWPQVLSWQPAGQALQIRVVEDASAQALLAEAARLLPP